MLSVLIVNWNTRECLQKCVDSLHRYPCSGPIEIIVVDNASTDGSADMMLASFPSVLLLEPGRNLGYAAGNNLAFSRASGDFLLTLNPDAQVVSGTLDAALGALERHKSSGAAAARLVGVDGSLQRSVRGFPSIMGIVGDATGLGKIWPKSSLGSYRLPAFNYEVEGPAPQPMGTFLMFRRLALEAVGDPARPFDESFPMFFNEVDLLYRLRRAGWSCIYTPSAVAMHLGGASTRQVRKDMIWESHRSLARYLSKHSTGPRRLLPVVSAVLWLAALWRAKGVYAGFRA